MNELQKVEYELLRNFLSVCEKLNLTYYLVCGSALGAVKYGGFIPWDDDIDVALPREDYEVFCRDAPTLLPKWCFVQNWRTDPEYHRLGTKLRDSRTTYVEIMTENLNINHGVFIDVFPLDGMPTRATDVQKLRRERARFEADRRVRLRYNRLSPQNVGMIRTNLTYLAYKLFGVKKNTAEAIERFDSFVSSFSLADSEIWCNHANSPHESDFTPKEWFGEGQMMTFEGLTVRIPTDYNAYLTKKYGDWQEDIPKDEKTGHHTYTSCDLHLPQKSQLQ